MSHGNLNQLLSRRYNMLVFDWDGTAVASRRGPVDHLIWRTEALLGRGVWLAAVTGTNFANLDRQFFSFLHPKVKANMLACVNRGSEVYGFDSEGCPVRLWAREATDAENAMMDKAVDMAQRILKEQHDLAAEIVSNRMNRRKLDIMPFPKWDDPPKEKIAELLQKTQERLKTAGIAGLASVIDLVLRCSEQVGLDGRVTSDVKHIELGLTDKADSVDYLIDQIAKPHGIDASDILFIGDEFGSIGGCAGSDSKMITPKTEHAAFISVGQEPEGVSPAVHYMGGGIESFSRILDMQMNLWRESGETVPGCQGPMGDDPPSLLQPTENNWGVCETAAGTPHETGWDVAAADTAASYETLFTLTNGYLSVRGAHEDGLNRENPGSFVAGVFDRASGPYDVPELVVIQDPLPIEICVDGEKVAGDRISDYRRQLDMRAGILHRFYRWSDGVGRIISVESERFVSDVDEHLLCMRLSVTMQRGSGRVSLRSRLNGNVSNSGVAHLAVDSVEALSDGSACVCTTTIESEIGIALACVERAVTVKSGDKGERDAARKCEPFVGAASLRDQVSSIQPVPYQSDSAAGHDFEVCLEEGQSMETRKFIAVHTSRDAIWRTRGREPGPSRAQKQRPSMDELASAARANAGEAAYCGYSNCKAEHAAKWSKKWECCDIRIDGPARDQTALRFALYHLASLGPQSNDTVSIAAKGLHGQGYKGHVFWDTEIFILPFYVAQFPDIARRLLMYRYNTLPGARRKARENGFRGAMYAWESADSGDETTPKWSAPHPETGERARILCGELEDHITADVAYAVWEYCRWTGDWDFMESYGMEIIVEAARFWASRAEWNDEKGRYDILGVIGPDEFHEQVDNNAFTNYVARWTLLAALELAEGFPAVWDDLARRLGIGQDEPDQIRRVADLLYLPAPDPDSGVIEQFEGYHHCERKLIKQADVVMLGRLLPDLFDKRVWSANWRYYEPRTTHLSSLSASAHSAFASYLGLHKEAYDYFEQCIHIELQDEKGNLKDGVHAANLGGMWQAVVCGFAGMRLLNAEGRDSSRNRGEDETDPVISIDPRLPSSWDRLHVSVECRSRLVRATITPYRVAAANRLRSGKAGETGESQAVVIDCAGRRQRVAAGQSAEFVLV